MMPTSPERLARHERSFGMRPGAAALGPSVRVPHGADGVIGEPAGAKLRGGGATRERRPRSRHTSSRSAADPMPTLHPESA